MIAKGVQGGLGNMNFANSVRQAPRFAEPGRPGEEKLLTLEFRRWPTSGSGATPTPASRRLVSRLSKA